MTPELKRLLGASLTETADLQHVSSELLDLTRRLGLDYFMVGSGFFSPGGDLLGVVFNGSVDPAMFEEYDEAGFGLHDPVVESVGDLSPDSPMTEVYYGAHQCENERLGEGRRHMMGRINTYGMGTGMAFVSKAFTGSQHHGVAVNFGTARVGAFEAYDLTRRHGAELLIAANALLPKMRPQLYRKMLGLRDVKLTPRERDLMFYYAKGLTAVDIAKQLGLRGVRFHSSNLKKKLNAQTIAEALVTALRIGLM